jgi:3-phenylpropionate/trans-cinnamate dioxygenase ferredoxin reductase subunit
MTTQRHVIVGGGVAAASAAATLRSAGFEGDVVLVSNDTSLPYERPPLSKDYLKTEAGTPHTVVHDETWYADNAVETRLSTSATTLYPEVHQVALSDGEVLDYDAIILATGMRARRAPGEASDRVLTLRSLADATHIRDRLAVADHVVILGGGFIGCEVAATAVGLGKHVTIVERLDGLMAGPLGPTVGRIFADMHTAAGVAVHLGHAVLDVKQDGELVVVRTDRGTFAADLVVVGAGSLPNEELAAAAGIRTDHGILTDEFCRTSAPDVYAAGDVAASYHPHYRQHLRVEHHDTALRHGAAAARSALGMQEPFNETHWFWSDQYGLSLQQVGRAAPDDKIVVRGSYEDLSFSAFAWRAGRIQRVVSVNRARDVLAVRRLLFEEHHITPEELADESVALNRLVPRPSSVPTR